MLVSISDFFCFFRLYRVVPQQVDVNRYTNASTTWLLSCRTKKLCYPGFCPYLMLPGDLVI